jgi:hypothetical protein
MFQLGGASPTTDSIVTALSEINTLTRSQTPLQHTAELHLDGRWPPLQRHDHVAKGVTRARS